MALPEVARRHYLIQQAITRQTVQASNRIWAEVDRNNLTESYMDDRIGERLFVITSIGQQAVASEAEGYVSAALATQSIDVDPDGLVNPRAFAGVASDGRNLESLLYEPVIATKAAIGAGANPTDAMRTGQASLTRIVMTQMQDAGRVPVGVATFARPRVGYVRMLNPPSCARCVVLAGRFYRSNQGFQRHPGCDCRHIPTTENVGGDLTTDPDAYFASLNVADQDSYFTQAGAEAIRDGADLGQVVNARRGMYQANGWTYTSEGTTRRGFAGRRLGADTRQTGVRFDTQTRARARASARLMPETIYEQARDRDHALDLLRQHGFIVRP